MKTYWKTLIGLLVALPMLAYVAGTLVAAQQEPPQYDAIVLRPADAQASSVTVLDAVEEQEPPAVTPQSVEAITPGPDDLDDDSDDAGRDDRDDGDDSSGKGPRGSDDDSSGTRKDDDDDKSGSGSDDDEPDDDADDTDDRDDDSATDD
jgi:hypothetical protein